jgi:hypothetical protein
MRVPSSDRYASVSPDVGPKPRSTRLLRRAPEATDGAFNTAVFTFAKLRAISQRRSVQQTEDLGTTSSEFAYPGKCTAEKVRMSPDADYADRRGQDKGSAFIREIRAGFIAVSFRAEGEESRGLQHRDPSLHSG